MFNRFMLRGSQVCFAPDAPAAAAPATPTAQAATLYPADGGAGAATTAAPTAGTDTVAGAAGSDTVAAGASETTLPGGLGNDTVAGADTAAGTGDETKTDTSGNDTITAESYDFKIPDGVSVDEGQLTSLKTTLAEAKVSPEVAQSLLDMHVKALETSGQAFATAQKQAWDGTISSWKAEIDKDPELGGDKRATVTTNLARALDEYGDAKTRAAFELTGSGWNPDIIRFVNRMATALNEGGIHAAGGPSSRKATSVGSALYPEPQT